MENGEEKGHLLNMFVGGEAQGTGQRAQSTGYREMLHYYKVS